MEGEEESQSQSHAPGKRATRARPGSRAGSAAPDPPAPSKITGRKRRIADADDDEEMAEAETGPSKKRAVEHTNAVQSTSRGQPSAIATTQSPRKPNLNAGAAPGEPDRDDDFLQALASKKKGKKAEDDFDREFNQLKISKASAAEANNETEVRQILTELDWSINVFIGARAREAGGGEEERVGGLGGD